MLSQVLYALFTVVLGVGCCVGYFFGSNWLLDRLLPANTSNDAAAVRNLRLQAIIRPWLFLGPALLLLGVYLVYPHRLHLSAKVRAFIDFTADWYTPQPPWLRD